MEQRKFTQDEMNTILQSIDGISKAEAPPFFYTRLQARLDKQDVTPHNAWMLLTKPAVSLVTLSLLLILNIAVIRSYVKASKQTVPENTTGIEKFAEEYDLGSSAYSNKTTR